MNDANVIQNGAVPRRGRRHVPDDELRAALADPDNVRIVKKVLGRFSGQMHEDDLGRCGMIGTWRALAYHRDGLGQKWTTNLYGWVKKEVLRELGRQERSRRGRVPWSECGEPPARHRPPPEDMELVRGQMKFLSPEQRQLIEEHLLEGWTLDDVGVLHDQSKEGVRQKVNQAVRRLRELCLEVAAGV